MDEPPLREIRASALPRSCSKVRHAPQGGTAKQRRELQRRGSILDTILGEANALGNQLGQADRGRLE